MFKAPTKYAFLSPGPPQKVLLSLRYHKALSKLNFLPPVTAVQAHNLEHKTDGQRPCLTQFIHRHLVNAIPSCWHSCFVFESLDFKCRSEDRILPLTFFVVFSESLQVRLRHSRLGRIPSAFLPISSHRTLRNMSMHTNCT